MNNTAYTLQDAIDLCEQYGVKPSEVPLASDAIARLCFELGVIIAGVSDELRAGAITKMANDFVAETRMAVRK